MHLMALKKCRRVDTFGIGCGEDGLRISTCEVDELSGGTLMVGGSAEAIGEEPIGGTVEWIDWRLVDQEGIFDEAFQRGLWIVTNGSLLVENQT